jgi:hypothetical protein
MCMVVDLDTNSFDMFMFNIFSHAHPSFSHICERRKKRFFFCQIIFLAIFVYDFKVGLGFSSHIIPTLS